MKQIIPIGGGGFASEKSNLKLEKYIMAQVDKATPKICFLPQASSESPDYIVKFFQTFTALGAEPSWVSLFGRVGDAWKKQLLNQDIIYVGGGNTKSMMALWRAWGVDVILREAYERGVVLTGVSAGGICWFEQGITDSVWPLGVVDTLGFLKGSFCPHFDSETERPAAYREKINKKEIKPGLALEDNVAAHFVDGKLHRLVCAVEGKKAIKINVVGDEPVLAEWLS